MLARSVDIVSSFFTVYAIWQHDYYYTLDGSTVIPLISLCSKSSRTYSDIRNSWLGRRAVLTVTMWQCLSKQSFVDTSF